MFLVRPESRRKLILVSKVLQNIANGLEFGEKEEFMKLTNEFIISKMGVVENFIEELSVRVLKFPLSLLSIFY
jgi:hypothetical protein